MAADLSAALAVISIALAGDPVAETWSIGGAYPGSLALLGEPSGICGTHNRYEGDASMVRGDAYLYGGNVDFFQMQKWNYLNNLAGGSGFTQDKAARMAYYTTQYSVINNPYYFSGPFSGLVAPDAHNFVVNLMSNHSAANPGGVTGSPGSFKWTPGYERIPDNWYKRPAASAFTTADTNLDTVVNNEIYPGIIKVGGNTGKVNSFAGVDLGNLTGGVYNSGNLFTGNNLSCFFIQAAQQGLLDFAAPLTEKVGQLTTFLTKNLGPVQKSLNCPAAKNFDKTLFNPYPGASYETSDCKS